MPTPEQPSNWTITLEEIPGRQSASVRLKGNRLMIKLPSRLKATQKQELIQSLTQRALQWHHKHTQTLALVSVETPRITIQTQAELSAFVSEVNGQTLRAVVSGIRLGNARLTRLAQMNCKTHVMTVSRHCLVNVPIPALRYLIVHELSHLTHPNHSRAFWNLVAEFVPDWRKQSAIIQAHHYCHIAMVDNDDHPAGLLAPLPSIVKAPPAKDPVTPVKPKSEFATAVDTVKDFIKQLSLF